MIARRRLIGTATVGAAGTLIAYGCQAPGPDGGDQPDRPADGTSDGDHGGDPEAAEPDPDLPLLAELITDELALIETYRLAVDRVQALPAWCRDQLADHERHLRALRDLEAAAREASDDTTADPTPSVSPSDTATTDPPANAVRALLDLRKREQRSAEARDQRLERAHDGRLARVIAAMAASDQLHADRLAQEAG